MVLASIHVIHDASITYTVFSLLVSSGTRRPIPYYPRPPIPSYPLVKSRTQRITVILPLYHRNNVVRKEGMGLRLIVIAMKNDSYI
jgi:hypothetical protein